MEPKPPQFQIAAGPATLLLCALSVALAGCSTARPGAHQAARPASTIALPVAAPVSVTNSPPPPVSFAAEIRLAALMDNEKGVTAAFVRDKGSGKHVWSMKPGDSEDGMELVEADVEQGVAVLKKGLEVVHLALRAPDSPSPSPVSAAPQNQGASAGPPGVMRRRTSTLRPSQPAQTDKLVPEHSHESQTNLVRQGIPLPIPLTKNQDDQLVLEGILPPSEQDGNKTKVLPAPNGDIQNTSKAKVTEASITEVCEAIAGFEIDMGYIPTSEEGLRVLVANPGGGQWHGPYIKGNSPPLDAWGTPLRYAAPAIRSSYTVMSAGPDKNFETKDDITRKWPF